MLTELKIKNAVFDGKRRKLHDEKGLYVLVTEKGKYWRFDYRFEGKRKTISLGVYPEVSLKEARQRRDESRRLLRDLIDPSEYRKKQKAGSSGNSLKELAEKWFTENKNKWSEGHAKTILYRLRRYIYPQLGDRDISELKRAEILSVLKDIQMTGKNETARRVNMIISNIYQYAADLEITEKNPSSGLARHLSGSKVNHRPAIVSPEGAGRLLYNISTYRGDFVTRIALQVLAYTFVRPGELRLARWSEINFEDSIWDIPAIRMKMKSDHRVFLSRQVVELLKTLHNFTGKGEFVFSRMKKPISENTLNKALRTMGYDTRKDITAHGFRAMARTLIHEKLGYPPEVIEHQLAHKVPDMLGQAYNRTKFFDQRKKMMQEWADYLDRLRQKFSDSSLSSQNRLAVT